MDQSCPPARPARSCGDGRAGVEDFLGQLGDKVRLRRKQLAMTRRVLSQGSGVSERYLAQLEAGAGNISIVLLRQVANCLGLSLRELLAEPEVAGNDGLAAHRDLLGRIPPHRHAEALRALDRLAAGDPDDPRAGRIALIGLRGAGKSTLGRALAQRRGVAFVELNREIEAISGLPVPEIFSLYGEAGYRRLERESLRRVIEAHDAAVIAVGGGLVGDVETCRLLMERSHTVWLRASPADHMARVRAQGDRRPMDGNPEAMRQLQTILNDRAPLYARAELQLDTSGMSVETALDELCELAAGLD